MTHKFTNPEDWTSTRCRKLSVLAPLSIYESPLQFPPRGSPGPSLNTSAFAPTTFEELRTRER